jgi:hypothetical protein
MLWRYQYRGKASCQGSRPWSPPRSALRKWTESNFRAKYETDKANTKRANHMPSWSAAAKYRGEMPDMGDKWQIWGSKTKGWNQQRNVNAEGRERWICEYWLGGGAGKGGPGTQGCIWNKRLTWKYDNFLHLSYDRLEKWNFLTELYADTVFSGS